MENRKPVPEALYDELKTLAALRDVCALQFRAENGGSVTVETKIRDVFRDADGEYLLGDNGLTLHLHQIVSINGQAIETFC